MSDEGIPVEIRGMGRVYFPKGMTPDQIQAAIESDILPKAALSPKAMNAGEYDAASPEYQAKYGNEGPSRTARVGRGAEDIFQGLTQRILQGAAAKPFRSMPSIQELRAAVESDPSLKGLSDDELRAKYAATDPAADYTQEVNDQLALYNEGRTKQGGGFDKWRLAGNIAASSPLSLVGPGGATMGMRAVTGGTQGALSGAAQFAPSGNLSETARNAAVGGVTGAVAAPAIGWATDKLGDVTRRIAGWWQGRGLKGASPEDLLQSIPELKDLPETAQRDLIAEAQAMVKKTGTLDAEQIARKANLLANGVTPTKAMITRDPADWTREANLQKLSQSPDEALSGIGQELTKVRQANDKALASKLTDMRAGLPGGTPEAQGQRVMEALDNLSTASQEEVGKLYTAVRQAKGEQLASDARNLASTLDELRDNTYAEKLVSSVTNKLRRFGMLDPDGNLTSKTLTVSQAEELRKFVNKLPNDFGKQDIIRSIDADVLSGAGEDAFAGARTAAAQRFGMLKNPATQRALAAYGELTQGKTAQNFIQSQVVSGSEQDVKSLLTTLAKLPQAQADDATNALRAGVLQHLESKAINPNSGQFSGAKLSTAMRDVGEGKLRAVLGEEGFKRLQSLARAGVDATYEPAYSAVNHSNTAPMLLSLARRARVVPGVPMIVTDNAENLAARSGYQSQLSEALAAQPKGQLPPVSPAVQEVSRALLRAGAQAPPAALYQARKKPDRQSEKRK